jgi:hypothetical protein
LKRAGKEEGVGGWPYGIYGKYEVFAVPTMKTTVFWGVNTSDQSTVPFFRLWPQDCLPALRGREILGRVSTRAAFSRSPAAQRRASALSQLHFPSRPSVTTVCLVRTNYLQFSTLLAAWKTLYNMENFCTDKIIDGHSAEAEKDSRALL